MNTEAQYPRIITNGRRYAVEIAPNKFSTEADIMETWVWQTRFLWRARRRLNRIIKEDALVNEWSTL